MGFDDRADTFDNRRVSATKFDQPKLVLHAEAGAPEEVTKHLAIGDATTHDSDMAKGLAARLNGMCAHGNCLG